MKKTLLSIVLMLAGCLCASAQFEQGKKYIGASLSNIDLSYNKARDFNFGMNLNGGYFLDNEFLVKADLGYAYESKTHAFNAAAGARYYFERNGIFIGAGGELQWRDHFGRKNHGKTLLYTPVELGYAFFINRHVTVEPSAYYKICYNEFKDHCEFGFKIGFGVYF